MENMSYGEEFEKKDDPGTPGDKVPQNFELEEWALENNDQIIALPLLVASGELKNGFEDYVGGFEIPENAKPIRMCCCNYLIIIIILFFFFK